jgi:hypothetical protein
MSHASAALQLLRFGLNPHPLVPNEKRPLASGWQRESDWAPDAVRERFERAPAGHGLGLRTDGLCVIDVDGAEGRESLARLEADFGPLPRTVRATTRGGGLHVYLRTGIELRNSVKGLAPSIDIRSGPSGQVVAPPTEIDGKVYRWEDGSSPDEVDIAELPPRWLEAVQALALPREPASAALAPPAGGTLQIIRRPEDATFEAERRARYMATLTEPSIQGQNGNAVMMRAAFHAKEMSRNEDEAIEAMLSWNARLASPPWSESELRRAISNSEAVYAAALDRWESPSAPGAAPLRDERGRPLSLAYVQPVSRYVGLNEAATAWALDAGMDQTAARRVLLANGFGKDEAKRIIEDHTVIHAVAVDTIPNATRVALRDGHTVLNAWVPPTIKPAPGDSPVLDEVITFVSGSPEGETWLTNWLAAALQRPGERFRTAPILSGQQRTGKSVLIRAIRALIGEANSKTIRSEDITSRFSASFATGLLVAVGEIETADLDAAQGRLRYLTGEDRIVVEGKFAAAREVKNRLKLIGSTNKRDPVRVDAKDTRWSILRQNAEAAPDYLARVESLFNGSEWSERGLAEVRALGHRLISMRVDESVVNVPLKNAARAEAITMSRTSVQRFADAIDESTLDGLWVNTVPVHQQADPVYRHLDIPNHPGVVSSAAVYALYREFTLANGQQPVGSSRFSPELAEARPSWELLAQVGDDDRRIRLGRQKLGAWGNLPRDLSLRSPAASAPNTPPPFPEPEPEAQPAAQIDPGRAPKK